MNEEQLAAIVGDTTGFRRHNNGGGWVGPTAIVPATAFIGPDAHVSGCARVLDYAQVLDYARIFGYARVSGCARVYDYAQISGCARVLGDARISGYAQVSDCVRVFGYARVSGDARVSGNARIFGYAQVSTALDLLCIGPIGSRDDYATYTRSDDCIATGCWRGTVHEFLVAVAGQHGDNEHARAYRAMVDFIRSARLVCDI